jgi:DNA (cytosine-5)-methyltransferase 1
MKLGSLCSGYGGLDLAVKNYFNSKNEKIETIWFAENDKNCTKIINHHWGDVPNYGNIKTIDWNLVPPCDILVAGYPCQPFSIAGHRKGSNDERAIYEYIADGISALRPEWVVLENVAGHLTLGGTSVVASLASMGYDAKWGIIRASDAGAPHKRARWFCFATHSGSERHGSEQNHRVVGRMGGQAEIFNRETGTSWKKPQHRVAKNYGEYTEAIKEWERITRPAPTKLHDENGADSLFVEWLMGLPSGWVTGHGLSRAAELKMLGNGVVPQQGELALRILSNT